MFRLTSLPVRIAPQGNRFITSLRVHVWRGRVYNAIFICSYWLTSGGWFAGSDTIIIKKLGHLLIFLLTMEVIMIVINSLTLNDSNSHNHFKMMDWLVDLCVTDDYLVCFNFMLSMLWDTNIKIGTNQSSDYVIEYFYVVQRRILSRTITRAQGKGIRKENS